MKSGLSKFINYLRPTLKFAKNTLTFSQPKKLASLTLFSTTLSYFLYNHTFQRKVFMSEDLTEYETIAASEVVEGQIKEVRIGKKPEDVILMTKLGEKYYAFGTTCPHAGAPLAEGALFGEKIICPWHDASFSIITGKPEYGPVLDGIQTFEVNERDGKLYVKVPRTLNQPKEVEMLKQPPIDHRKMAIIGGGPAALSAAETLRQCGFAGEIYMIIDEPTLPYDRTRLSKEMNLKEEDLVLRKQEHFDRLKVKIFRGKIKSLSFIYNTIHLDNRDEPLKYNNLLVATGARAVVPEIPGNKLQNIFTLRTLDDYRRIKDAVATSKNVVLVGGSFITSELAGTLKREYGDKIDVTMVLRTEEPFEHRFGKEIGQGIREILESFGVKFQTSAELDSIGGSQQVNSLKLKNGKSIPADMIIFGTGTKPNSELVSRSTNINEEGALVTDLFMQTSLENVFAAGDVAEIPFWYSGQRIRHDHLSEAIYQGQIAAYNMLNKKIPHSSMPFYWSKFGESNYFEFVGSDKGHDKIYIDGSVKNRQFVAYYSKENVIIGAAVMGTHLAPMIVGQAMEIGVMPSMSELIEKQIKLEDIKKKVASQKKKNRCKRHHCQCQDPPTVK